MYDWYIPTLKLQQSIAIESLRISLQLASTYCGIAAEATPSRSPRKPSHTKRRSRVAAKAVTRGVDLKDRYGKRAHDVEVEHI